MCHPINRVITCSRYLKGIIDGQAVELTYFSDVYCVTVDVFVDNISLIRKNATCARILSNLLLLLCVDVPKKYSVDYYSCTTKLRDCLHNADWILKKIVGGDLVLTGPCLWVWFYKTGRYTLFKMCVLMLFYAF